MPTYTLVVTFTTDEADPAAVASTVSDIISAAPDTLTAEAASLSDEDGTTVDLIAGSASVKSAAPPAPGPQSVDPDNPPEHSLPTGKEF